MDHRHSAFLALTLLMLACPQAMACRDEKGGTFVQANVEGATSTGVGQYTIENPNPGQWKEVDFFQSNAEDLHFCVVISPKDAPDADTGIALVFWLLPGDNYEFRIRGGEEYAVFHWVAKEHYELVPWRKLKNPKREAGQPISFEIERTPLGATVYIDGVEITSFIARPPQGVEMTNGIGVVSGKKTATYRVSDFRIFKP